MTFDPDAPIVPKKFDGLYKGYVRDNADPQNRGCLRVYCPQVSGDMDVEQTWLPWAEAAWPWTGGQNTMNSGSPPTIQQQGGTDKIGVWIMFQGGHPDFPVWMGTFTVAPTAQDPNAQQDLTKAAGVVGASIIEAPPNGTNLAALDPPQAIITEQEVRILARKGQDIIIMADKGGSIVVGVSGVQITGAQVTINGVLYTASAADKLIK